MIGKTISHYRILEKIGEGGMGEVYLAEDTKLKRNVALKFLPSSFSANDEAKKRFLHEAQSASGLEHNNICSIHEIDEDDNGQLFIVMSCYEGEVLKQKLENGPIAIDETIVIVIQIAEGLSAAHNKGIIHRDIKPANIFITNEGIVKILDFGLAKSTTSNTVTKMGTTSGTVSYMSPEQSKGEKIDHRTDIWALGVVMYEMITGKKPFEGDYDQAVVYSIINEEPESITSYCPDVPVELEQIIKKALGKNFENRFQGADDILTDLKSLRQYLETDVTTYRKTKAKVALRKRAYLYICIIAVVILLIGGGLFIRHNNKTQRIHSIVENLQPALETGRLDEVFEQLQSSALDLNDIRIEDFVEQVAGILSIESHPPDANVILTRVGPISSFPTRKQVTIGRTPITNQLIIAGEYVVRLSASGMNKLEFLTQVDLGSHKSLMRKLLPTTEDTKGMVIVTEGTSPDGRLVPEFLIDQKEVTNAQFLKFVAEGGYRNPSFWPETMMIDGQLNDRALAIQKFTDRTGILSPRFWPGGKFPDGKGGHPVVGISWYEASAYAQWIGKELPSRDQWYRAAIDENDRAYPWGNDVYTIDMRANFGLNSTSPVGSYPLGISPFGCFDMAGNVREWLCDPIANSGRLPVVGGSWQHPGYMFEPGHAELFDPAFADEGIGFRCVKSVSNR